MRFQILCDSCCDLTATERLSSVFEKVPAEVELAGARLRDDKHFCQGPLLHAMAAEPRQQTVCFPDARAYLEAVDPAAEAVYLVTSSAEAFDQYAVASRARRLLLQESPGRQIHVFNTRSGSVGELVTARRICALARSGCSYRQIVERVESELLTAALYLLPASGEGLRCCGLAPRGSARRRTLYTMSLEGRLVHAGSALTARGLEQRLLNQLARRATTGRTCIVSHCGCPDAARRLADRLRVCGGFSSILLAEAGAVTSLLLRPGGVAVGF